MSTAYRKYKMPWYARSVKNIAYSTLNSMCREKTSIKQVLRSF